MPRIGAVLALILPLCFGLRIPPRPSRPSFRLHATLTEAGTPLSQLLTTHADTMAAARAQLSPEEAESAEAQDDVFVLRFVLGALTDSDPGASAGENLKDTLQWRWEQADMLASAVPPHDERVKAFLGPDKGTFLTEETTDGCPVSIIRAGQIDAKALMKIVSAEELTDWFLWMKEQAWRSCQDETRARGVLVQAITANDLYGTKIAQDKNFGKALGSSSKLAQKYYPALQSNVVLLNLPLVAKLLFAFFKPLLPEKVVKKLKVCPGNTLDGDIQTCPFAPMRLQLDKLPKFLGGNAA